MIDFEFGLLDSVQIVVTDDENQNLYLFKDQIADEFNQVIFENL